MVPGLAKEGEALPTVWASRKLATVDVESGVGVAELGLEGL